MGIKINGQELNIQELVAKAQKQIDNEPSISDELKTTIDLVLSVMLLLVSMLTPKNSKNSHLPPAMDPNRHKKSKAEKKRKPGGQPGHEGKTLKKVKDPDEIIEIKIDKTTLGPGHWKDYGFESRQIFDIKIKRYVTEYRAQRVINEEGKIETAKFPEGLVQEAQYGNGVKAHGVYMSVEQCVPCDRVADHFESQMDIPLSAGSICNFKKEAYTLLEYFEIWVISALINAKVLHFDETGVNIASKRGWIHIVSTDKLTYYYPHEKRGTDAMDKIGIIGKTDAKMVHDHWKPYYAYENKTHALCNAHHIRELTAAQEEGQKWAERMIGFLYELNKKVDDSGGELNGEMQKGARKEYHKILRGGEKECPRPPPKPPGKRGRVAKSKTRNLLERLIEYEDDVLRFMTDKDVPFTNNQAERDLRMIKVHQKVSGCFRSWDGAKYYCRIKGYLSTCKKQGVSSSQALKMLFNGEKPAFMLSNENCG